MTVKTEIALQAFILVCVMLPEWIHKAQKQLDDIVGQTVCLVPTFADPPHLPYIEATMSGECIVFVARSGSL